MNLYDYWTIKSNESKKKKKKQWFLNNFPLVIRNGGSREDIWKLDAQRGERVWRLRWAIGVFADYLETWYIVPRLVNVSVTFFNFIIVTAPLKLDSCMKLCAFWSSSKDIIAIFFPFDRELALARKLSILKNISDTVHRWPEGNPCYLNLSVRPATIINTIFEDN